MTDDEDDIILIEQKGKEMVKEIELIMETVERQWILIGKRD